MTVKYCLTNYRDSNLPSSLGTKTHASNLEHNKSNILQLMHTKLPKLTILFTILRRKSQELYNTPLYWRMKDVWLWTTEHMGCELSTVRLHNKFQTGLGMNTIKAPTIFQVAIQPKRVGSTRNWCLFETNLLGRRIGLDLNRL